MGSMLLVILVLVCTSVVLVQGQDIVLDAEHYQIRMTYPNFTIFAKWDDGTVFEGQYVDMRVISLDEGNATTTSSGTVFEPEKRYSSDVLRQHATWRVSESTVQFLSGSSAVTTLTTEAILPDGGNITLLFEVYENDGQIMLGSNIVNISAERVKYSAFVNNWNFASPERQLRIIVQSTYISGDFDTPFPTVTQHDWSGPTKNVETVWERVDNFQVSLGVDVWCVADGVVMPMSLSPNPFRDAGYFVWNRDVVPKYLETTFGFVLPRYENTVLWDPSLYAGLFGSNINPATPPSPGSKTVPIVAGSVAGAVIVAAAAVGILFYFKGPGHEARLKRPAMPATASL